MREGAISTSIQYDEAGSATYKYTPENFDYKHDGQQVLQEFIAARHCANRYGAAPLQSPGRFSTVAFHSGCVMA